MPKKKMSDNGVEKIKKRVATLVRERPSHKEALEFYKDIFTEQYLALPKIKIAPVQIDKEGSKSAIAQGFPLMEKKAFVLDVPSAARLFRKLCKILGKTKKGQHDSKRIIEAIRKKEIKLPELFRQSESDNNEYLISLSERLHVNPDIILFLVTNSIKPIYEAYADELKKYIDQDNWLKGYCPICGSEPYIAELKNEGGVEGARFLVCSSCNFEWRFSRLKCPFCENGDHKKLRYFYTEKEGRACRVDVCEKCKRYIKTVDTNEIGEVILPLEDIGTLHLDLLARDEGYTKEGITSKQSFS